MRKFSAPVVFSASNRSGSADGSTTGVVGEASAWSGGSRLHPGSQSRSSAPSGAEAAVKQRRWTNDEVLHGMSIGTNRLAAQRTAVAANDNEVSEPPLQPQPREHESAVSRGLSNGPTVVTPAPSPEAGRKSYPPREPSPGVL
jgi:hypothetical protein